MSDFEKIGLPEREPTFVEPGEYVEFDGLSPFPEDYDKIRVTSGSVQIEATITHKQGGEIQATAEKYILRDKERDLVEHGLVVTIETFTIPQKSGTNLHCLRFWTVLGRRGRYPSEYFPGANRVEYQ